MSGIKNAIKQSAKLVLSSIPFVKSKFDHYRDTSDKLTETRKKLNNLLYISGFEPGHFYSPIPDLNEIKANERVIWGKRNLPGIDMNTAFQVELLEEFKKHYGEYLYNKPGIDLTKLRYQKEGAWYRFSDCVFLHSILMHFKPKRMIEIGSGHSSALTLDLNEHYFNNELKITFIEPYPKERLLQIMTAEDHKRHEIIEKKAQEVSIDKFKSLGENDILFIDTTHVSKVGSDVNYLFLEILPQLNSGVLIHIHDIFYPFEMPQHWVQENRWYWNENYLLHAFLINNKEFEIVAFNSYTQQLQPEWFAKEMPECLIGKENTGSIWLRKK